MSLSTSDETGLPGLLADEYTARLLRSLVIVLGLILAQAVMFLLASCIACCRIGAPSRQEAQPKRRLRSPGDAPDAFRAAADSGIAEHALAIYGRVKPAPLAYEPDDCRHRG